MASEPPSLPEHIATCLLKLTQALDQRGIRYALIGAMAAAYRSQPRFTQDVDLLLQVPQVILPGLLDDLQARGFVFEPGTVVREWTQAHMTVLSFRGVRVDWLKPILPCFQHVLDSARAEPLLGTMISVASAEGLILTKLLAGRFQDFLDIQNLLAANRGQLDLDWIRREWQTVFDADDPRLERFEALVRDFYNTPPTA